MKLQVEKSYSGALGSAGQGQVIEVTTATGKKMIKDGYPVSEVKESGGTRKTQSNKDSQ